MSAPTFRTAPRLRDDPTGSRNTIVRARARAAELARQHRQPLVLWRDGRIVGIMPDDLPPLPEEALRQKQEGSDE